MIELIAKSDLDFMLLELSENALNFEIDYDGGFDRGGWIWIKAAFKNKIPEFEEHGDMKDVVAKWANFSMRHLLS